MNSSKHKLYDYEVTPPADAWNNISAELNDIDTYKNVAKKLEQAEVPPPHNIWAQLSHTLDEEDYFQAVSKKLNHIEITPPPDLWSKIQPAISNKKEAAVVPMHASKSRNWRRFAVAASIIALLGLLIYNLAENSFKDTDQIWAKVQQDDTPKPLIAKNEKPVSKNAPVATPKNTVLTNVNTAATQTHIKTKNGNAYSTTVERNKELDGRYIVLMTEDGDVVRMSKKLGNIADCIAGAANNTCDDQIKEWQKEIASNTIAATPDNFLNILELANEEGGM